MADQITHVRSECVKCLQEDIETHLESITELTAKNARLRAALEYSFKLQKFAKAVSTGAQDRELSKMEKVLWKMTDEALKG